MKVKILILIMLAVVGTTTSCSAKVPNDRGASKPVVATDTIMQKAVGDSIYNIITRAKSIEMFSLPLASDSIKSEVRIKIPSKEKGIVNFIVTNPKNFLSDTIAYGNFFPQLQLKYTQKKEVVTLKYDFGLRKWGVFDANNVKIGMYDLASDNMLRYACQKFPDNTFLYELLMTREPQK